METTFEYLRGREFVPADFDAAVEQWKQLPTDAGAKYDKSLTFKAADHCSAGYLGNEPWLGCAGRRKSADAGRFFGCDRTEDGRRGARLHGPARGRGDL